MNSPARAVRRDLAEPERAATRVQQRPGAAPTRAEHVLALQRTAGNAAVARLLRGTLMRTESAPPNPAVTAEPAWSLSLDPGGLFPGRPREVIDGTVPTIHRGDTLVIRATFSGLTPDDTVLPGVEAHGGGTVEVPAGEWESADTFVWRVEFMSPGEHGLVFLSSAQEQTTGRFEIHPVVSADIEDFTLRASRATDLVIEKFANALGAIGAATAAWTLAHTRHTGVLGKAEAADRLTDELMLSVIFAVMGGATGGALGGFLKTVSTMQELAKMGTAGEILVGAITDAGKDGVKSITRISADMASGALVDGKPINPEPVPKGDAPTVFFGKLHAQLGLESAALVARLGQLKDAVADARARGALSDEIEEDPVAFIENDTTLEMITEGLKTNEIDYRAELWLSWLGEFALKIEPAPPLHIDREPHGDEQVPQWKVGDNISSNLHAALEVEATECGTTLDEWLAARAPALRARLEAEVRRLNMEEAERFTAAQPAPAGGDVPDDPS